MLNLSMRVEGASRLSVRGAVAGSLYPRTYTCIAAGRAQREPSALREGASAASGPKPSECPKAGPRRGGALLVRWARARRVPALAFGVVCDLRCGCDDQ